jgi:hypothetical protein
MAMENDDGQGNHYRFALPLIALPGTSPRIVTGRREPAATSALSLQRWRLAKSFAKSSFTPSLYGEKMPAGR